MQMLALCFTPPSHGGVQTVLLERAYQECMVRVIHDAAASAGSATLVYRVYRSVAGLHQPCELDRDSSEQSLRHALIEYRARPWLPPIASIMIGRMNRYRWVREQWAAASKDDQHQAPSDPQVNARVGSPAVSGPFARALRSTGFVLDSASCEKVLRYQNGALRDAMCWLHITASDSANR